MSTPSPTLNEYDFKTIETHQQALWENDKRYYTTNEPSDKPSRYMLSMFPYPSGKLHMGHVRNYAITDVLSRYYRLKGYEVMQPMGWDAFGLPAENAAIANHVAPAKWTYANIDAMRQQLKSLGLSIDWGREFATCDPDYYRWEQWLFLQLYKKGLVYKKLATVNWDPVDKTVLANEQVVEGRGWRSGAVVEKRDIPMFYFKITDYADELLDDLDKLEGKWPKQVLAMQKNWIGRSSGMQILFHPANPSDYADPISVFTTRPDTLMGVSYLAVSAEHPLAIKAVEKNPSLQAFAQECKEGSVAEADLATLPKKGVATDMYVIHPLSGQKIPVWIANYVLMSYGSGAVMGVPAHDKRDFEFAKQYNLPIIQVIDNGQPYSTEQWQEYYSNKNHSDHHKSATLINSGELDGYPVDNIFDVILQKLGDDAEAKIQYRLRDWGVSRQRYWGCPIPVVNCDHCGTVPVDEADLPILLPTDVIPDGRGNPLKHLPEFLHTTCPKCGQPAERETDTFDTFVESSWYAQRFVNPNCTTQMIDPKAADKWLPIDQYVGGIEHAVMHLLYARFFYKVMRDEGIVTGDEPFSQMLAQGMVLAQTYYRTDDEGKTEYYFPDEITVDGETAILKADGKPVTIGKIEKMSKSKNNGVDPETILSHYGADTARLYTLFTAPAEQTLEWSDNALKGPHNFIKKVWRLCAEHLIQINQMGLADQLSVNELKHADLSPNAKTLRKKVHESIKKIDISLGEHLALNTPISTLMELSNEITGFDETSQNAIIVRHEALTILLTLLAIFAPHVGEYLLQHFGIDCKQLSYPICDNKALISDSVTMVVQVNGKVRGQLELPTNSDNETIKDAAKALDSVAKYLTGDIKKIIVVPNKLVSIVV